MDCRSIDPLSRLVQLRLVHISLANFRPSAKWPALESLTLVQNKLTAVPNLAGLRSLATCIVRQDEGFHIKQPLAYVTSLPSLKLLDLQQGHEAPWSIQSFVHLGEAMYKAASLSRKPALVILP